MTFLANSYFPQYLNYDPSKVFRASILTMQIGINALIFSAILCLIVSLVLVLHTRKLHKAVFLHSLKVFAIVNIPLLLLTLIVANKTITSGSMDTHTSTVDIVFGLVVAILIISAWGWLLVKPVAEYLYQAYRKRPAWVMSVISVMLAMKLNPAILPSYFDSVIDDKEYCVARTTLANKNKTALNMNIGQCIDQR